MLGLEVKIISNTKTGITIFLQELIKEIQNGETSAFLPLNDIDNTEGDFSIVSSPEVELYNDWSEFEVL